ncbi:MAG: hypothetical protein ABIC19_00800 [Patescibacteria group bacterium]|nr:hypothetical protein [Patescibacteria group bacterium]
MDHSKFKNIYLITGPQGVGKKEIVAKLPSLIKFHQIIPTTTRPKEKGEIPDKNFHFISWQDFQKQLDNKKFLTCFFSQGNHFGVTQKEFDKAAQSKLPVIWNINYDQALNIKNQFPGTTIIFITAPLTEIRKRLITQGIISENIVNKKLLDAKKEIDLAPAQTDHLIVFNQQEQAKALSQIAEIIRKN